MHGWFGFSMWNLSLALATCIMCVMINDPASKGSGIPEVLSTSLAAPLTSLTAFFR